MLPRLIATDLDGTLLGPGQVLTPRTVAALGAAVTAGIEVVLVTARPPRTVAVASDPPIPTCSPTRQPRVGRIDTPFTWSFGLT